jgi:hypothetical protein
LVVAVLVGLSLALPPIVPDAHAADTEVRCGLTSEVKTDGFDGTRSVATYVVRATWCVETTYEAVTITERSSSDDELSGSSDEPKVEKKKGKKGKKGRRARKRSKRSKGDGGGGSSTPRTRTERRAVSTCITNFELDAEPATHVDGAHLIGVTTTQSTDGDACATRSYRVAGRFGRDYVAGVPGGARTVLRQQVGGLMFENYPLGRFGSFDIVVHFAREGSARCERCVPSFEFCDVRIVGERSSTCVRS